MRRASSVSPPPRLLTSAAERDEGIARVTSCPQLACDDVRIAVGCSRVTEMTPPSPVTARRAGKPLRTRQPTFASTPFAPATSGARAGPAAAGGHRWRAGYRVPASTFSSGGTNCSSNLMASSKRPAWTKADASFRHRWMRDSRSAVTALRVSSCATRSACITATSGSSSASARTSSSRNARSGSPRPARSVARVKASLRLDDRTLARSCAAATCCRFSKAC